MIGFEAKLPKVSVIIPAHNDEKHIQKCLLSLKEQTFKDFEIIVVDDDSLDTTYEIASRNGKVIKTPINIGEGAARNLGAKEAKAEILAFVDADTVVPKDWVSKIIHNMETNNVKCVGGGYAGSLGNSFIERFACLELAYRRKNMPEFVTTAVSNNFACDRKVFFECGTFPENFKCEDLRLSFVISKKYPIFWDKDNGVLHHFKTSLLGYLRQQFFFGRDTVFSYYQYPEMFLRRTHQGRMIYLETILMFFSLISLRFSAMISISLLTSILMVNFGFLLVLKRNGLPIIPSCLVILIRDVICVISIFAGIGLCFKDIARRLIGKKYNENPNY